MASGAKDVELEGRACGTCHWLAKIDTGYSNWTVMDTTWRCLLKVNPYFPADESCDRHGQWRKGNEHGKTCKDYRAGEPVQVDVDHEKTPFRTKPGSIEYWLPYTGDEERARLIPEVE